VDGKSNTHNESQKHCIKAEDHEGEGELEASGLFPTQNNLSKGMDSDGL